MLKYYQNLHTHSTYCDGKDSIEGMIQSAIAQGMHSVGFSGHSYMHYAPDHSMSIEGTEEYIKEVRAMIEKYKDKIDLFCGLEFDMYSTDVDLSCYDYVIGTAHYLLIDGKHVGFDRTAPVVAGIINDYFGGDGMKYAKMFYETLAQLPNYGKFDILGHADLICKFSEKENFFDESDPVYQKYAKDAIDALTGKIPIFEVNTGAISRGYRTTPYPNPFLLKHFKERGWHATISSDCHDARYIRQSFEDAGELLKAAGFREYYVLTKEGFKAVSLD
jgi:histidinol-phosphatase (PHP family)